MKKIIFVNIPMKKIRIEENKLVYKNPGNQSLENDEKVVFPINSILASTLQNDDEVKIILITKNGGENKTGENVGFFISELNSINLKIGAKINYEIITSDFVESANIHEKIFRSCLEKLEKNCEIFCDITYGPKTLPIILFCVLNFAEKYFAADIKNIIYGKVDFVKSENDLVAKPVNPEIYDIAPLYYLNSLTNIMNFDSEKDALSAIDSFFKL